MVCCYLDNDVAGRAALAKLQREFGNKVMDKSSLYPQHKDLNEYLVANTPKNTISLPQRFAEAKKPKFKL